MKLTQIYIERSTKSRLKLLAKVKKVSMLGIIEFIAERTDKITDNQWKDLHNTHPSAGAANKRSWDEMTDTIRRRLKQKPQSIDNLQDATGYSEKQIIACLAREFTDQLSRVKGSRFKLK